MELVSLRCNRDFTSASSYGLRWYKYAIVTQWYQFHTTDACWFSLIPLLHDLTLNNGKWVILLGLYSLSGKTSYRKISWSLKAAIFRFKLFQSLWNLAGTLAALLPRCLWNFRTIRPLQHPISRLRDFTRFGGKTSYRLVNRGPDDDNVIERTYSHNHNKRNGSAEYSLPHICILLP